MKRPITILLAAAAVALAGCSSPQPTLTRSGSFGPGTPAYLSMSAGDKLGSIMLENRLYVARVNGETNAYASVDPDAYGD
jgi:hypothetical protein